MERIQTAAAAGILAIVIAATFPLPVRSAGMLGSRAVYTAAQAAAGARPYAAQCSSCHGATLRGGVGPALIGEGFRAQWSGKAASDPYKMMTANMPQNAPGSLKPAE